TPTYRSPSSGRMSLNASRCTLGDSDNTDTINESRSSIAAPLITLRRAEYDPNKLAESSSQFTTPASAAARARPERGSRLDMRSIHEATVELRRSALIRSI